MTERVRRKPKPNKYGLTRWMDGDAYYNGDADWIDAGFIWRDRKAIQLKDDATMFMGEWWEVEFGTEKTALLQPFYRLQGVVGTNAYCTERLIKPKINRLIDGNQTTPLWMRLVMVGQAIGMVRRVKWLQLVKAAYYDRRDAVLRYGEYATEMTKPQIIGEIVKVLGLTVKFIVVGAIYDTRVIFGRKVGRVPRTPNPYYWL